MSASASASASASVSAWPRLTSYTGAHLDHISLPVGGIGTGTIGLAGHGALIDWEITNRPNKGHAPRLGDHIGPALMIRAQPQGGQAQVSLLEGPIPNSAAEGWQGCAQPFAGFPRFRSCAFHSAYPFAEVELRDSQFPIQADLCAFNPLIPGNADDSGLPVAMLSIRLHNPLSIPVEATVAAVLPNVIGDDGQYRKSAGRYQPNAELGGANSFSRDADLQGLTLRSTKISPEATNAGEIVIVCAPDIEATWRTAWNGDDSWGNNIRDFWKEFLTTGRLQSPAQPEHERHPIASLAPRILLQAGETTTVQLIIAWRFPNRRGWEDWHHEGSLDSYPRIGNYYAQQFPTAWEAAAYAMRNWDRLERETLSFVNSVIHSDLPKPIIEAALCNISTLRSPTLFRDEQGNPFAWEGVRDHTGSCHGNCLHVWNYEHAIPALFPELARRFRDLEFTYAQDTHGALAFRIGLPLTKPTTAVHAAADGHMGAIVRAWREWHQSGDSAWLGRYWPAIKKAIAFAWEPGSWDADQDGVIEGCQHNTMDVEYYGPNVQITGLYLAALAAGERMATHLGEPDFSQRCAQLRQRGSAWVDQHLFNGSFYIQDLRAPGTNTHVHPSTQGFGMGAKDLHNPHFQLMEACLIDQTVGQVMAGLYGLGDLLDPEHCRTTLTTILRHNRRTDFFQHMNPLRTFALNNEQALLMASYPTGQRPDIPFPYADEVMSGFEYTAAIHLVQAGMREEAVQVVDDIRQRHQGDRRNPFDEIECGRHYGRALASWGLIPAWTSCTYDGTNGHLCLHDRDGTWPWCIAGGWGQIQITDTMIIFSHLGGSITLTTLSFGDQTYQLADRHRDGSPKTIRTWSFPRTKVN